MNQPQNFKWPQGEDLTIQLIYKEQGGDSKTAVVVPLQSGYSLKMDIVEPTSKQVAFSVNSDAEDGPVDAFLSSGANGQPNITIHLPRAATLPGGPLFEHINAGRTSFQFDVFLRNDISDRQVKVLRGNINIEKSYTLWQ